MNLLRSLKLKALAVYVFLFPVLALAQAETTVAVSLPPLDFSDPGPLAKLLLDAVMNKQWGIVASLAITLIIAGLRKWVPEASKFGAWMRTKLGAIVMNFGLSLGTGFLTLFLAGEPFSVPLVVKALSIALGASGSWAIFKNVSEALSEKKAQDAGTAAEKKPTDTINL